MKAKLIFIRRTATDAAAMDAYRARISSSPIGNKIKRLVRYGHVEVLEGSQTDEVIVLEFDTVAAAARAWYSDHADHAGGAPGQFGSNYDVMLNRST